MPSFLIPSMSFLLFSLILLSRFFSFLVMLFSLCKSLHKVVAHYANFLWLMRILSAANLSVFMLLNIKMVFV